MLKSPKELQEVSLNVMHAKVNARAEKIRKSEAFAVMRKDFESACLTAALERKTRISFDPGISQAFDLDGFKVEQLARDDAREKFLASKMAETKQLIDSNIEGLRDRFPKLTVEPFPNKFAKTFLGLVANFCVTSSAQEVLDHMRLQLNAVWSVSDSEWSDFAGHCEELVSDCILLSEVHKKHARVSEINAAIPKNLETALRISWEDAAAEYGRAGILHAEKLKWISTVWPKWEKHFNVDIEDAAHTGSTSRTWQFSSASYWGDDDSFVVGVGALPEDDVSSMTEDELEIHLYWKEIEEREGSTHAYDEEEGFLIGVHPLPVAEIFLFQGFKVKIIESAGTYGEGANGDEDVDGDQEPSDRYIELVDLDDCSVDLNYQLEVRWGAEASEQESPVEAG